MSNFKRQLSDLANSLYEATGALLGYLGTAFIVCLLWRYGVQAQFPGLPRVHYWFVFAIVWALGWIRTYLFPS